MRNEIVDNDLKSNWEVGWEAMLDYIRGRFGGNGNYEQASRLSGGVTHLLKLQSHCAGKTHT